MEPGGEHSAAERILCESGLIETRVPFGSHRIANCQEQNVSAYSKQPGNIHFGGRDASFAVAEIFSSVAKTKAEEACLRVSEPESGSAGTELAGRHSVRMPSQRGYITMIDRLLWVRRGISSLWGQRYPLLPSYSWSSASRILRTALTDSALSPCTQRVSACRSTVSPSSVSTRPSCASRNDCSMMRVSSW